MSGAARLDMRQARGQLWGWDSQDRSGVSASGQFCEQIQNIDEIWLNRSQSEAKLVNERGNMFLEFVNLLSVFYFWKNDADVSTKHNLIDFSQNLSIILWTRARCPSFLQYLPYIPIHVWMPGLCRSREKDYWSLLRGNMPFYSFHSNAAFIRGLVLFVFRSMKRLVSPATVFWLQVLNSVCTGVNWWQLQLPSDFGCCWTKVVFS